MPETNNLYLQEKGFMLNHTLKNLTVGLLCWSAAACGMFSDDHLVIDGDRISVLEGESILQPDFQPGEVKIVLPQPVTNIAWEQNGGNAVHMMGHPNSADMIQEVWDSNFGEGASNRDFLIASPVVKHKVAFAIDADAIVSAYRMDNGEKIWKSRLKPLNKSDKASSLKGAGLAVNGQKVFATTGFGTMFALDMMTGKKLWRFDNDMPFRIAPTVSDKYVFAQTIDNTLIALDANNGQKLWEYRSVQEVTTLVGGASPAYDESLDTVVAAFSNGELRAIKASTGTPLWSVLMVSRKRLNSLSSINAIKANPVIDNGVVYALGNNYIMMAIDLRTGMPLWEREISGTNQPWVAGDTVFVLSNTAELLAIQKKSGKIIWSTKIPLGQDAEDISGTYVSGPVLTGHRLIVATSKGYAFAVSPYSGKILGFIDLDEGVSLPPVVAYDTVLFTTNDADLIAYK